MMRWLLIGLVSVHIYAVDLATIRQEPNRERRSQLALDNANTALDAARRGYQAGDLHTAEAALDEVGEFVDLAYQSLPDSGKTARRNPGLYKRAELALWRFALWTLN